MSPFDCGQLNTTLLQLQHDDNALSDVYQTVGGRMFALAFGILRNRADAEDAVSDSLVKIMTNVKSYRPQTNAYGWVMKIVRNTCLDRLRRRKIRAEENIDDFFHLTDGQYGEDNLTGAVALEQAIEKLPERSKKMIYYRYYLDMTVREIATERNESKSAIEREMQTAEYLLRSRLADESQGGNDDGSR